ncbi:MAG: hypothetical protein NTZ65_00005 [Candidatus Berkelbacteria bacterium]|nr:hypothetical protein [Candidatus Berkelbacteria bacterium]
MFAQKDGCFDQADHDMATSWARVVFVAIKTGEDLNDLPRLEVNETLEEVYDLIALMSRSFDFNHAVQVIVMGKFSGWIKDDSWREEFQKMMDDPVAGPALKELEECSEDLVRFFRDSCKAKGMPESILNDSLWFGQLLDKSPDELRGIAKGTHPAFAMAAMLLLKFRYDEEAK